MPLRRPAWPVPSGGRRMSDDLPTPRSTLQSGLCVLVRCTACRHRDYADLQKLVNSGRGDVPLIRLRTGAATAPAARSSPTGW